MSTLKGLEKNRDLVSTYRLALNWDRSTGVGDAQQSMMDDLEDFCGLNQAKFQGGEHDMIKNLGRIEVLGRIRFFLNYRDDDMAKLHAQIEEIKR